ILKFAGAFHWLNTSRIRSCAFSYSAGEPCGRSFQLIMYFIEVLLAASGVGRVLPYRKRGRETIRDMVCPRRTLLPCEQHLAGSRVDVDASRIHNNRGIAISFVNGATAATNNTAVYNNTGSAIC